VGGGDGKVFEEESCVRVFLPSLLTALIVFGGAFLMVR
jgi:hypothetical protein